MAAWKLGVTAGVKIYLKPSEPPEAFSDWLTIR